MGTYNKSHPGAVIDYQPYGSSAAIKAVTDRTGVLGGPDAFLEALNPSLKLPDFPHTGKDLDWAVGLSRLGLGSKRGRRRCRSLLRGRRC